MVPSKRNFAVNVVATRIVADKVTRKGTAAMRAFAVTSSQSSQQRQSSQGDGIGWSGGQKDRIAS
jgi:hypothetical protein